MPPTNSEPVQLPQPKPSAAASKPSRNRSKASCNECYRRKQKCDRKWPCNRCLDRRTGHLCQFSTGNLASARTARARAITKAKPEVLQEQIRHSEVDSVNDGFDEDRSCTIGSRTSSYSPTHSSASSSTAMSVHEKALDGLGYLNNNPDNLLGYLKTMNIFEHKNETSDLAMTTSDSFTLTPEATELLKKVPSRTVTDVLIQHFFSEANWIYEMIYPATFIERYNEWWSGTCQSVEYLEFAALLLRLCSYSAQFLPSQNYTADTILGKSLSTIREQCDALAISLSKLSVMEEGPSSITRIHELFFRACYLKNEGDMKGSWSVLSKAIRDAHELGLHLDLEKGDVMASNEYELEMGKRTYWNLWLWDKFMSTILGRWPLIPDQFCTVSLPHEVFGSNIASDDKAPNAFCERRLQIELAKIVSEITSPSNSKPPMEPAIIDENMKKLEVELLDKLPPAFRLHEVDERWDKELPHLTRQREMFRISVFATICLLLKPVIVMPGSQARALTASDRKLVAKHRISLVDALIEMIDSVGRLHTLMGGKHNRFFLLSFFTLEPAALLGICLMTPDDGKRGPSAMYLSRGGAERDQHRWKQGWKRMEESVARLEMLSEVSSIARTGVKVLKKLMTKIDETEMARSWKSQAIDHSTESPSTSQRPKLPVDQVYTHPWPLGSLHTSTAVSEPSLFERTPSTSPRSQENSSFLNTPPEEWTSTYGLDVQSHDGVCNSNLNWDLNLTDSMPPTSNMAFFGPASVPWPGYLAPIVTGAEDPSLSMVPDQYDPGVAMGQDIDWNWLDDGGQMGFGN